MRVYVRFWWVLLCLLSPMAVVGQDTIGRTPETAESMSSVSILVNPGEEAEAIKYYQRLQNRIELQLLDASNNPTANLDQLINHFGFQGISAKDLEELPSFALMPSDDAAFDALAAQVTDPVAFKTLLTLESFENDNVLVSRFFAPKIVDYSALQPFTPGWRKLVRLKALPGSPAFNANLSEAYILFNFVRADAAADPFESNTSKNNQVILVPRTFSKGVDDSAYFMVFLEKPAYTLGFALEGVAFDLPALKQDKYFVPGACAQCHGHDARSGDLSPKPADGVFRSARVNYLDTDQWHDMVRHDFPHVSASANGGVFDGGKLTTDPAYKAAFDVIRKLNLGARDQNRTVDTTDFKIAGAEKWLSLHATSGDPVPFDERTLSLSGLTWNMANPDERDLLDTLNRYCFRCHSSIRYNVFDKQSTADASFGMEVRLRLKPDNTRYMPNGRILPDTELERLIDLINRVFP